MQGEFAARSGEKLQGFGASLAEAREPVWVEGKVALIGSLRPVEDSTEAADCSLDRREPDEGRGMAGAPD